MKILAIRGKNLASLSAEFCLDFQAEPLASAGLFGITGPTGAGKSTLLDALCVALYERTPRLSRANTRESIPDVGEGSIGPADPRTLLRRGAGEGWAEVDFAGSDGVPYRARWSVRRARNKSDGALQKSEMSLTRLPDNQVLGDHRKTETLKLIEALVGLSFEQFTRAVLLAQNDFATFLKASDDERAELLQTLTGTGTFSRISQLAFARARDEKERQAQLEQQLADQAPLAPDIRAGKDLELAGQDQAVKAAERHKAVLEGHLRWHGELQKLGADEASATERLGQAEAEDSRAAERRAALARIDSVQPARPLRDEALRLERETGTDEGALRDARLRLTEAGATATARAGDLAEATRQAEAAEQARLEARPDVDRAKALDASIEALLPGHAAALKGRDEAAIALQAEETRRQSLEAQRGAARQSCRETEHWLGAHSELQPLAEHWPRWDLLLNQAASHLAERDRAAADVEALKSREQSLRGQLDRAGGKLGDATSRHQSAVAALEQAQSACAAFDPEGLARRRGELESRRDLLAGAVQLWQALSEQQQRRQGLAEREQFLTADLAGLATELTGLRERRPGLEQELAGAERALRLAEVAASESVETLRAGLAAEEPCPVCGALSHPWAEGHPAAGILQALRDDMAQVRGHLAALGEAQARAGTRQEECAKQVAGVRTEIQALNTTLENTRRQWDGHGLKEEAASVPEMERQGWFGERLEECRATLARLAREEASQREAAKKRDQAQQAAAMALSALEKARSLAENLAKALAEASQACESAEARRASAARMLEAALEGLDAALPTPSWREAWRPDPTGFAAGCRARAEAWRERQQQGVQLTQRLGQLDTEIRAASDACEKATRHHRERAEACRIREVELQEKRANRGNLLGGRPVARVEAELALNLTRASEALTRCRVADREAGAAKARQEEAVRLAEARIEKTRGALAVARQALADWLSTHTLAAETVAELLAHGTEWIAGEREALQGLARAVQAARAVLAENTRRRAAHEAARPSPEDADALRAALEKWVAELETRKEALGALRVELARDDEKREKSVSLRETIDQQAERTRVWARLNDLIGSADGKKFRNFAQQLTLDILLGYANRHLETLSRRYRLKRIRDSLGLLVVDQDMGDEVRSVHSLSGGESFLVSLALALGLASLSSHRVKVESLFIDEGFGSLDADSLGVAMEALDKLQAQGRKVGVISHVQEMTERLGTRIQVSRLSGGKSRVEVAA